MIPVMTLFLTITDRKGICMNRRQFLQTSAQFTGAVSLPLIEGGLAKKEAMQIPQTKNPLGICQWSMPRMEPAQTVPSP